MNDSTDRPTATDEDVTELFSVTPIAALELLCKNVDRLTRSSVEDEPSSLSAGERDSRTATTASRQQRQHLDYAYTAGRAGVHPADEAAQQKMLAKRFVSKRVPPITIKDYLLRLHRFCPMSCAVYLAVSSYITRIVVEDGTVRLTPKNMHRLVLAGLRVAVKFLEDWGYAQSRFARVGGVSERELSRLEIGFCFLVDFELLVDASKLMRQVRSTEGTSS